MRAAVARSWRRRPWEVPTPVISTLPCTAVGSRTDRLFSWLTPSMRAAPRAGSRVRFHRGRMPSRNVRKTASDRFDRGHHLRDRERTDHRAHRHGGAVRRHRRAEDLRDLGDEGLSM